MASWKFFIVFVWATPNIFEFGTFSLAFDFVTKHSCSFQNPQVSRCSLRATVNSYNILCCLWINVPVEKQNRQNASNLYFRTKKSSEAFTLIKRKKQTLEKKITAQEKKRPKKLIVWCDRKEKPVWWKLPDCEEFFPEFILVWCKIISPRLQLHRQFFSGINLYSPCLPWVLAPLLAESHRAGRNCVGHDCLLLWPHNSSLTYTGGETGHCCIVVCHF